MPSQRAPTTTPLTQSTLLCRCLPLLLTELLPLALLRLCLPSEWRCLHLHTRASTASAVRAQLPA